jgi:hypothetical protein
VKVAALVGHVKVAALVDLVKVAEPVETRPDGPRVPQTAGMR